ncbi:M20 aminoacylase family protein [Terrarubrum flagellatum]|uniref:M20 aminoacylase family protein n=1 Tax=Terrirubrum flagellatum TaxID=2895980 RepID=UPI003144F64D
MPVINRVAELADEITVWRRHLHENPEILYEVHETAAFVADKLKSFGVDEVVTGLGRTGVVGVIKGAKPGKGKTIALRADMDALPIEELTDLPYKSKKPGAMHACGHDGHTAMVLGAAKYLAETRNFAGTAVLIFQPAEEGGNGALAMIEDGMMERFGVDEVYGLHNDPTIAIGKFGIRPGAVMAAMDRFTINISGKGSHGAAPHLSVDPVLILSQVITALQSIASRNVDPIESIVVSTCVVEAGSAFNIIPQTAKLVGTVRTLSEKTRDLAETRMKEICAGVATSFGAKIDVDYWRGTPVLVNNDEKAEFAAKIAREVVGEANVNDNVKQIMGGEDFAFMLNSRPGAFIFLGNGDTPYCHHPSYNFSDEAIPFGVSYFVRLVETATQAQ